MARVNRNLSLVSMALAGLIAATAAPSAAQPQATTRATKAHVGCNVCDGQRLLNEGEYDRAMHLFQRLAAEGNAQAINDIGFMYQYGLGRPVDYAKARQWYRKAGELNEGTALANLGDMYENGIGTDVDFAEAMRLYRKGAQAGGGGAAWRLAHMYQRGLGGPVDLQAAFCWYLVALDHGDEDGTWDRINELKAQGQPWPIPPDCHRITDPTE